MFSHRADYIVVVRALKGETSSGVRTWFWDDIWCILERCWKPSPNDRPSIEAVLRPSQQSEDLLGWNQPRLQREAALKLSSSRMDDHEGQYISMVTTWFPVRGSHPGPYTEQTHTASRLRNDRPLLKKQDSIFLSMS